MRFKLGEGIFLSARQYPIKSKFPPIDDYGIDYKIINVPNKSKDFKIEVFNLDEFRSQQNKNDKLELE